jgi:hypothetical protein
MASPANLEPMIATWTCGWSSTFMHGNRWLPTLFGDPGQAFSR